MSGYEASAPLTGTLLSSKGAAAPSNSVASLLDDFAVEAVDVEPPVARGNQPQKAGPAYQSLRSHGAVRDQATLRPRAKPVASQERIKLSLRLSADQHLRLKLAAAHLRQSSQALLMAALDEYLAKAAPEVRNGGCNCLMSGDAGSGGRYHDESCGHAD